MIAHLNACASTRSPRYVCNCGADAQNATATKLDQAESTRKADTIDRRWGVDPESERRLDAMLRETQPAAATAPDTPLRAAARMLDRLHARATHHDSPRHLLATAHAAVELAATLAPAEAIRVLDGVEPEPAAKGAAQHTGDDVCPLCSEILGAPQVCAMSHDPWPPAEAG